THPARALLISSCIQHHGDHRDLHSFPTRRSSDLKLNALALSQARSSPLREFEHAQTRIDAQDRSRFVDREELRQETASVLCVDRSEEHTSELQSLRHLVCRLLLEKKNSSMLTCRG